jgi:hypothetical protein
MELEKSRGLFKFRVKTPCTGAQLLMRCCQTGILRHSHGSGVNRGVVSGILTLLLARNVFWFLLVRRPTNAINLTKAVEFL